jgi:hypothetical protein
MSNQLEEVLDVFEPLLPHAEPEPDGIADEQLAFGTILSRSHAPSSTTLWKYTYITELMEDKKTPFPCPVDASILQEKPNAKYVGCRMCNQLNANKEKDK